MAFSDIYQLGDSIPLGWNSEAMGKKLSFVLFPYNAKQVTATATLIMLAGTLLAAIAYFILPFAGYSILFLSMIAAIIAYIYPSHIFYAQAIGEYNEEMLRAVLRMTTFISMDTSIEYAFVETTSHLHGTLEKQFRQIKHDITRKQKMTLGEAMEPYIPVWNEINPVFVKSMRLLQTAALSSGEDRDKILSETVETMLLNYSTLGKRYAEELASNAQKLITVGILIPIMSLMLLPLLSIFLPQFTQPAMLAFVYIILFPTITLLMALNFGAKRIQVDTVRIQDAQEFRPISPVIMWLAIGIAVVFPVITFCHADPARHR
jgi:hypothetical protein